MNVSSATASTWSSSVAWSRLQSSRFQLAESLTSENASPGVIASVRATIENAANQVSRVEAAHAADLARIRAGHHTVDLLV
ncbi:hypothetical protein [Actinoplanes sp. DH11]|uniref:hypothetical protein n=1 Tax=Actinoplanes sp. DH11 TaxID=2857011 RepID=UPI001E2BB3E9|nr:hypothetical protein [Actinoplanes sp. DH11]